MIQNKLASLLLVAGMALGLSAKTTIPINPLVTEGFNATEHLLQKPLPNDTFPKDYNVGNRFFLGFGGGIECIGDEYAGLGIRPGYRLSAEAGYWFTPVHGLRLGGDAGLHSVHKDVSRVWFIGARAEYLVNLTTLLRGFDPARRFEIIGAVGVTAEHVRQNGLWTGNAYGALASMQCRFNVQPSLYLYVEPRLAMLTNRRYDLPYDWRRTKVDLSLNLGVGYRILAGKQRRTGATPFLQADDDNLFFGCGVGLTDMTRSNFPHTFFGNHTPFGTAFAGKMFTAESGVEVNMNFGKVQGMWHDTSSHHFTTASLSYVVNLNNACGGYRPEQRVQIFASFGPSIAHTGGKTYLGGSAALTAVYNLNHNLGIFLRPEGGIYTNGFAHAVGRHQSFLASATVGLRYTIGDFSRLHKPSFEEFGRDSHKWFYQGGLGLTWRTRRGHGTGSMVAASFGKRFTPVSSWRLGMEGVVYPRSPRFFSADLTLDYLTSISTAISGYDPRRTFDLQGVLGAYFGISDFAGPIRTIYGIRGGLHGSFRVSSRMDIFIEPLFLSSHVPADRNSKIWVPELRIYAGMKYRFGGVQSTEYKAAPDDKHNFLSITAGPAIYSGSAPDHENKVSPILDVAVGHWFNSVNGARITYSSDWINHYGKDCRLNSVHVDYLINFTSIANRQEESKLHLVGAVGCGLGFCKEGVADYGFMTYGGLQLRYNLPYGLDVHIEPGLEFWSNRIMPSHRTLRRFEGSGRFAAGFSLRF